MALFILCVILAGALVLIPLGLPGTWVMVAAALGYRLLLPLGGIGVATVVGIAIVAQTLYAATVERLPEYATLAAMGAPNRYLNRIVLRQGLISGFLGYGIGIGAAAIAVRAAADSTASLVLPWELVIVVGMVALAMSFRGIGVMVVLLAVTVANKGLGVSAVVLYALAYSLTLGISLLEYFTSEKMT